ncbi:MAG: hypothetical protein MR959_09240 [Selenomonas bovis]|nr:hypothetical protein [Selenomonas bovis]
MRGITKPEAQQQNAPARFALRIAGRRETVQTREDEVANESVFLLLSYKPNDARAVRKEITWCSSSCPRCPSKSYPLLI